MTVTGICLFHDSHFSQNLMILPSTAVFCPKTICVVSRIPFYRYDNNLFSRLLYYSYSELSFVMTTVKTRFLLGFGTTFHRFLVRNNRGQSHAAISETDLLNVPVVTDVSSGVFHRIPRRTSTTASGRRTAFPRRARCCPDIAVIKAYASD